MFNPMSLEGKKVLVTGASSGIGRACAIYASKLGAKVVLVGRNVDALEETRAAMEMPSEHVIVAGDLADHSFASSIPSAYGPFDGFVHSAGICVPMPVGVVGERQLLETMRVNYFAFMGLMSAFSSRKNANEGFSAVAISSVSSSTGWAGGSVYAASKGALESAVRSLAVELAPKKFRVNAVCPSSIKTHLSDSMAKCSGDDAQKAFERSHPFRFGSPEQVASVVAFLLSDASSYMTGSSVAVDGGYTALSGGK